MLSNINGQQRVRLQFKSLSDDVDTELLRYIKLTSFFVCCFCLVFLLSLDRGTVYNVGTSDLAVSVKLERLTEIMDFRVHLWQRHRIWLRCSGLLSSTFYSCFFLYNQNQGPYFKVEAIDDATRLFCEQRGCVSSRNML